ncbi:hypothetical protein LA080_009729 [Diaporthe eres]|nr:hypothetical protein LA080_009729 [Diaporthe eres]
MSETGRDVAQERQFARASGRAVDATSSRRPLSQGRGTAHGSKTDISTNESSTSETTTQTLLRTTCIQTPQARRWTVHCAKVRHNVTSVREDRATAAEARCEFDAAPVRWLMRRLAAAVGDIDRSLLTHCGFPVARDHPIRWPSRDVAKSPRGQEYCTVIDDIHFRGQEGPLHQRVKAETEALVGPLMNRIWR